MHRLLPLVHKRTLSAVQLQLKLTRSLIHKSTSAERNPTSTSERTEQPEVQSDPFGLDYLGLDTVVQGLYSKSEDNVSTVSECIDSDSTTEAKHNVENLKVTTDNSKKKSSDKLSVTDKYKDWFIEKKPNTIGPDSELIRTTDFGFIRFDKDNAAKVQENDIGDYERVENERREESVATRRKQNVQPPTPITDKELRPKTPRPEVYTTNNSKRQTEEEIVLRDDKERDPLLPTYRYDSSHSVPTLNATQPPEQNVEIAPKVSSKKGGFAHSVNEKTKEDVGLVNQRSKVTKPYSSKFTPDNVIKPPPAVVVSQSTPKANANSNTPVEEKVQPFPRIYEMQDYNRITHTDMWNVIKHNVVYQNDFLIAINKPYGLPMHSPSRECRHTLNAFQEELSALGKCDRVYPLHRLDKDTTGVLLLAKTEQAADIIKKKFKDRQVEKKYITITKTSPHVRQGVIKIPISEGKIGGTSDYRSTLKPDLRDYNISTKQSFFREAITNFKVLNSDEDCAFVEIVTETGVKHQIRVHLAMGLGCPVLGDHKYSHREKLAPQRLSSGVLNKLKISQTKVRHLPLHLHCSHVKFTMPDGFSPNTEPVFVTARPPHFFMHSLRRLYLIKAV